MNFDNQFLEEVKERNDIVDVISDYMELKGGHGRWKGLCPFHNEKTPSFSVNESGQFYKCFGCQKGGDVIRFVQEVEKLDFIEAVKFLAKRAMIPLPEERAISKEEVEKREEKNRLFELHLEAARFFREQLFTHKLPQEYLMKRQLDRATILRFGLGYAPLGNHLLSSVEGRYQRDELLQSGLFNRKDDGSLSDRFKNRVMFPIFDESGRVIAFGGRALNDEFGPKYLNSPETVLFSKKHNLYAYHIAKRNLVNDSVLLAEGYMDTVMLHRYGISNAIASLGTAFTKEQIQILKKRKIQNVFIAYDSDTAGRNATDRAMELLFEEKLNPFAVIFDEAKDPDDYLKRFGVKKFQRRIEHSLNIMEFKILLLKERSDLNNEIEKMNFVREAIRVLKRYEDKMENSHILIEKSVITLAKDTGFSIKSVGQEMYGKYFSPKQFSSLEDIQTSQKRTEKIKEIDRRDHIFQREKKLLIRISEDKELIEKYSIRAEDFLCEENRNIFEHLLCGGGFQDLISNTLEVKEIEAVEDLLEEIRKEGIRLKLHGLKERQKELSSKTDQREEYLKVSLEIVELQRFLK